MRFSTFLRIGGYFIWAIGIYYLAFTEDFEEAAIAFLLAIINFQWTMLALHDEEKRGL